jgi:hypothetical protein
MMRVWAKDQPFGAELADLTVRGDTLSATGVAIGSEPCPYRLDYQLTTTQGYVTVQLVARTAGPGWRRALVLERSASGTWSSTTEAEASSTGPPPAATSVPWLVHSTATSACRRSPTPCPSCAIACTRVAGPWTS